jgi:hypothetical protein
MKAYWRNGGIAKMGILRKKRGKYKPEICTA